MIRSTFLPSLVAILAISSAAAAQEAAPESKPAEQEKPTAKTPYVLFSTTMGEILIELNPEKAPITVKNFLQYVEDGFYDETIFHRVIPTFVVQGGGFTANMVQKETREPIKNEWKNGLKNERGTLSMARLGGKPDSATSQFFINVEDNPALDQPQYDGAAYAVFGKVVVGMDVVDEIRKVRTTTRQPHADVPLEPIVVEEAKVVSEAEAKKMMDADKPQEEPADPAAGADDSDG